MPTIVCPTCATKLEIDDDMVGEDVQCGSCQQIFKADADSSKKKKSSRSGREDDEEKPRKSKYRKDDEDDDEERPSRRGRSKRDDDDDDEDDYEDRPSRRRGAQGGGSGMGIAALILGIVGLVALLPSCACCPLIGLPCPILSIIFGFLSLKTPGKGMGIAGIVMGGIALLVVAVGVIISIASVGLNGAANGGGGFRNNPPGRVR